MAWFTKKKTRPVHVESIESLPKNAHRNFMGGVSFDVNDPLLRLRLVAASCFFGEPMYYRKDAAHAAKPARRRPACALTDAEIDALRTVLDAVDPRAWRAMTPSEVVETAIDAALEANAEATLMEAVRLRNEDHIRTTPQVILVRAANSPHVRGSGLVRKYAPKILKRADEPAVALAYQLERYGRPIPNSLKRALRDRLSRAHDYELAKYNLDSKIAKTVDVVRLVHPKSESVSKLVKNELSNESATWEAILSKEGSSRESWTKAAPVMGHLALLRNLRNFMKNDVPTDVYLPRLVQTAEHGQAMPFRYASAYLVIDKLDRAKHAGAVKDALSDCLDASLKNLPRLGGRVVALADNSGSAQGTMTSNVGTMRISTIGNLSGILAARLGDEGSLGVFGDRVKTMSVPRRAGVFELLRRAEDLAKGIGTATENGVWLFFDRALRNREHVDHLFVFSDMQAGHGGLYGTNAHEYRDFQFRDRYIDVAKLIAEYRRKVNPRVLVYLVQIAGYEDALVPETYDRTFMLAGWSEGLLHYAARMSKLAS